MPEHAPHQAERHSDVAIVGGSAAGLAAALQIARQSWSVIVVDSGQPRNAPASEMHGYLGRNGAAPAELLAAGREEVRSYGGEVLAGRVSTVSRADDGRLRVELAGGHTVLARRVLAATGIVDELPDIEGLAEQWGHGAIHCPFCHGYEARDQRIVQIVTHPMGLHPAMLFHHLASKLTVVLHGELDEHTPELEELRAGGVEIRRGPVRRIVSGADGRVEAVEVGDERLDADVVAIGPTFRARAEPFAALGLRVVPHPSGLGDVVEAGAMGETSVPGLFAAGNLTDPSQQVLHAAAHGSRVGAMISSTLASEALASAASPSPGEGLRPSAPRSANEADWDRRYSGEQLWSGHPNGALVDEIGGRTPGRALDVGAGEGGDALWLAEQGWKVTASDISQRALDRITAEAERRGLPVACQYVDANAIDAFDSEAFDLVTAHYAAIPRTPDYRGVHNLLEAVAPGGTLLVVTHDPDAMHHQAAAAHGGSQAFDPDAYLRIADVAAVLAGTPGWEIEINEKRPRNSSPTSASHQVDDVILRARREGA